MEDKNQGELLKKGLFNCKKAIQKGFFQFLMKTKMVTERLLKAPR
jgi:hypothetical protein